MNLNNSIQNAISSILRPIPNIGNRGVANHSVITLQPGFREKAGDALAGWNGRTLGGIWQRLRMSILAFYNKARGGYTACPCRSGTK